MIVEAKGLGKKFGRTWVFRNINCTFQTGQSVAILGANGAGKSTLMRILAGQMLPTEGKVVFSDPAGKIIPAEEQFQYLVWVAPYIELIEEMTLEELLDFHVSFRPLNCSKKECIRRLHLQAAAKRQIRYFSSGMKQRLRLGLAFYDKNASVMLLDEPTSNLDAHYVAWYRKEIETVCQEKLVIIASNVSQEYENIIKHEFFIPEIRKQSNY